MNKRLEAELMRIAREKQTKSDPSHDFQHVLRVRNLAVRIATAEKADLDIVIPAALFHDIIVFRKDSPQSKSESDKSADLAEKILNGLKGFPRAKVASVVTCIRECSFSKGIIPESLESKILQDADRLEATGAISIMRTFSSGGQMNRQFYDADDPFCVRGAIAFRSDLDLFYRRLLVVGDGMHTATARKLARRRTSFLEKFLEELRLELEESDVL